MSSMYLALGYRCNHHCFFCPCGNNDVKTPAASTDDILRAIDLGVKEQGVTHITLSGGEPTLHPDFNRILKHCASLGLQAGLLSNGDTFHRMENVERFFADVPRDCVQITTALHSHQPEPHDRVTGSPGSFGRSVQGLLNVMAQGLHVTVKQVISRWNYQSLPDFVDFCFREFGPRASMTLCGMDFCGMQPDQISEVAVGYSEIGPCLEKALDLVISLRQQYRAFPQFTVADLPLCCVDPYYWRFFTRVSRSTLSQYSAPADAQGHVKSHYDSVNDCDIFFQACRSCCVAEHCPGVWYTAYRHFGESEARCIRPAGDVT
ncbi:MAG: radical SAM protein [Clostridia bacterium]|nr:radical SAM protein [Clostridia bacterium]